MWYKYDSPCAHAIAAILYISKKPIASAGNGNPYITWKYSRKAYRKCYERPIEPVLLQGLEPDTHIASPFKKRLAGRPVTKRLRGKYVKRAQKKCGDCKQYGHYKNKCRNQPVEHERRQRAQEGGNESDMAKESEFERGSQVDPNSDASGDEPKPPTDSELEDVPSDEEDAPENRRIALALEQKQRELDAREAQLAAMGVGPKKKKGKRALIKNSTPKAKPLTKKTTNQRQKKAQRRPIVVDSDDSAVSQESLLTRTMRRQETNLRARLDKIAKKQALRLKARTRAIPAASPSQSSVVRAARAQETPSQVGLGEPESPEPAPPIEPTTPLRPRRVRRLSEIITPSPMAPRRQQEQHSPTRRQPIRVKKKARMASPPQGRADDSDPETSGMGRGDRESDGDFQGT
ncbi:hypothetical protein IFR05_003447 [Cadophora sp. M221]|nr:hypothetical protein IFR05_003447 [Cadophora sp. M221]